jgi:hypothetical protein
VAQTVGSTGTLRHTLTANQSEKITLPVWAKSYSVYVEATAAVRVAPGTDAGAVEGSTTPTNYVTVGIGEERSAPLHRKANKLTAAERSLWLFSTGAAVVVVSAFETEQ